MTLRPDPSNEIPTETKEVAEASFPDGNIYMKLRDEFGVLFVDQQFEALYSGRGQPGESPWRLALKTMIQLWRT